MAGALRSGAEVVRDAIALGRRSLRPASWILLAVALVNFLRAGLAEEFSRDNIALTSSPEGFAMLATLFLLVLVFSVLSVGFVLLLPIQDGLSRGMPISERRAVSVVLHRAIPLAVSGLIQSAIVFGPPAILFFSLVLREMGAVSAEGGTLDTATRLTIQSAVLPGTLTATVWWLAITSILLLFAAPLLLLERRGPVHSIGLSAALVVRRVVPNWSQFLALALLWAALYAAVVFPEGEIRRLVAALPWRSLLRSTLPAAWSAASTALALAFGTAGLAILFRRLIPAKP